MRETQNHHNQGAAWYHDIYLIICDCMNNQIHALFDRQRDGSVFCLSRAGTEIPCLNRISDECLVSLFEAIMHETILIDMYHMYHMYIHRLTALA